MASREETRTTMAKLTFLVPIVLLLVQSLSAAAAAATNTNQQNTYMIHVSPSHKPTSFPTHRHWYTQLLRSLSPVNSDRSTPSARLLYSYSFVSNGFAAVLTESQADIIRRHSAVVAVIPDRVRQIHTTHTPSFLKLSDDDGIWPESNYASDVIVGVIDTGIYPIDRRSFDDNGLPPPPAKWKGTCETHKDFNGSALCNNKLIGARAFYKGYRAGMGRPIHETVDSKSPLDTEGHGTHSASTAAGSAVPLAGFYSYARGEARGMATRARIAAYKVCWSSGCYDSDMLAAFDTAVADGVNVISFSVGANGNPPPYYRDSVAIGSFGAVRRGIIVSCSAGNSGPGAYTVVNVAPWILTVGASTMDRDFPADVALGDGSIHSGVSLYAGDPLPNSSYPLVYGGDCGSRYCYSGRLNSYMVAGKIVLCDRGGIDRVAKGSAVKLAGGVGMILANTADNGEELLADPHLIPATTVTQKVGDKIRAYIKSSSNATANIVFRGTVIGSSLLAPSVAAFSSRGPSNRSPEILKPDIIAPGVNILAAWTGRQSPTSLDTDNRRVEFNIISGTSMACPHVSGVAALLRNAYSSWSPAAVKSALVTTAYNLDNAGNTIKDLATGEESTPFVRGAGHVDPNRALNPGLIYDATVDDYLAFLCSLGYTQTQMAVFTNGGTSVNCPEMALANPGDLNYPSFSVVFDWRTTVRNYTRTVRNVGKADSVYEATISNPSDISVTVNPSKLVFCETEQSLSFTITFESTSNSAPAAEMQSFGSIKWSDGVHVVRSPIAVGWSGSSVSSM